MFTPPVTGDYDILVDEFPCEPGTDCLMLDVELVYGVVFTCPPGAANENEACGSSSNDGCYLNTLSTEPITDGTVICGTVWGSIAGGNTTGDQDYYLFSVTQPATISVSASSEFFGYLFLNDQTWCDPFRLTQDSMVAGEDASIVYALVPGQYSLAVMPFPAEVPCTGPNRYYLSLNYGGTAGYCITDLYTHPGSTGINSFILNTLSNLNTGVSPSGHSDYTALSTDLTAGNDYQLQFAGTSSGVHQYFTVWVDFNDNTSFELNENILFNYHNFSGTSLVSMNIHIPYNAPTGFHRLRIRSASDDVNCACCTYLIGEVEDYMVNILPGQPPASSLEGTVSYDNDEATPMDSVLVILESGKTPVDSAVTDVNGHYFFSGIADGTYSLAAEYQGKWGGVNALDALTVVKHFVGMQTLTGLAFQAADVNQFPGVNSSDALTIQKRFVSLISHFVVPDWIFESPMVQISGPSSATVDFRGICVGDVNRSYVPQ